ncbi:hypothetical protein GRI58_02375 [Porphyrobacter algicida]|uniref:Uncharacterized protein n=1 Tax=Qipengyuania algicida TaxID=1836209 RepID=A0A845ADV0_9SPHN|nr:hypothetical protein [Qipengyuania algicida]MXP27667.1 hypothetical protein [Qipengyuania algicida]
MDLVDTPEVGKFSFSYQGTLNAGTPPGLFESFEGDRYVVVHACNGRLAIVLSHQRLHSLTILRLGPDKLASGNGLGSGEIEFLNEAPNNVYNLGTILVEDDGFISLRARYEGTEVEWTMFAATEDHVPHGSYDGWRISKWGSVFFEQTPPKAVIKPPYCLSPLFDQDS